jgi:alpha-beta hydrolase superfamily lysophospholipase
MRKLAALLLALSLSACVAQTLAPGEGPTAPRFVDQGHFQSSDGFTLAFSEWPAVPPAADPKAVIVALHGMNDYGNFIKDAATFWQAQGITTYAYDQRGFGRTEGNGRWPGHDVMAHDARVFLALVRARHPGARVYLLGESMGGAVAMVAAAAQPKLEADGLILVSPALWGWSNLDLLKRTSLWTMMQLAPGSRLSGRGLNVRPSDNEKMLIAMGEDPFVIKTTRVDALYGLTTLMETAWQSRTGITTPTLILYARGDEVVPATPIETAAASIPGTRRKVAYDDGYHMLLRDLKAERTWREINAFVTEAR